MDHLDVVKNGQLLGVDAVNLPLHPPQMEAAIRNAGLKAYERCAEGGDLRELANIFEILAMDSLLGVGSLVNEFTLLTEGCLRFKMDFRSEVSYDGWMYAGHHVLEAKDILLEPQVGDNLAFSAKGPLNYLDMSVKWVATNVPECLALGSRNLQKTDSELKVWEGFLLTGKGDSAECRCGRQQQSAEATGEKPVDFVLIMDLGNPGESWEEPTGGSDDEWSLTCIDPVWVPKEGSQWIDAMAETHAKEIFPELTGDFNYPLYLVIEDFDYIDKISGGRRKICQKHYMNALAEDPFFIWENLREETLITIWHDPLPVPK